MNTIVHDDLVFEVVETVPLGYEIWNIGKNMIDGYLPFCRISRNQPFPGGRCVETDTLKAIKNDGAQLILEAVGAGVYTTKDMERYIERHKNAKSGTYAFAKTQRIKKALPYMKQLKWA